MSAGGAAAWGLRPGADARLIAAVRARRLLYDAAHPRYSNTGAKSAVWKEIARELQATPAACKGRWNNIRDNYRKSLIRRASGRKAHAHSYKYTNMLVFMNKFFRCNDGNTEDDGGEGTSDNAQEDYDEEIDEHNYSLTEETHETVEPVFPLIKEIQCDVKLEQPESTIDYECHEPKESVSPSPSLPVHRSPMVSVDAVDAFLAGLSPTLKAMTPVHLSLAKAEIFAVVHKYEMKGLVQGGQWPTDADPLP